MGVVISYRGRLRQAADIEPLTLELEDICRSAGWKYQLLDFPKPKSGDEPFSGILIQPHPESENIWMLFNPNGLLNHPFAVEVEEGEPRWSWTKTQFAGINTHKAVCELLRYLEKTWFETLEVRDDTDYYHTGDEEHLRKTLDFLDMAIQAFAEELEGKPKQSVEMIEGQITAIAERLHRRHQELFRKDEP